MHNCFHGGDILLPQKISMKKWACVACDQYSSQPEYWNTVEDFVGSEPSTLHLIVPEAFLKLGEEADRISQIHAEMQKYLNQNLFRTFRRSFIYIERTMENGTVRQGLIGQIDLEDYDFDPQSGALIRATEETVRERIPTRMQLLEGAPLEFSHVLLLCDDQKNVIMSAAHAAIGEKVYDFDLMQGGGHITGHLISGLGVSVVNAAVSEYIAMQTRDNMAFVVGDGNHSLASAKAVWEQYKTNLTPTQRLEHPSRYALVELENIHDPSITFSPIHRVLRNANVERFMECIQNIAVADGYPIVVVTAEQEQTFYLDSEKSPLALNILQPVLDAFQKETQCSMDYIHGEDVVRQLSSERDCVGLILPGMDKCALFPGVLHGGVLPRKTFSMGSAREKRYYLEGKMRQ